MHEGKATDVGCRGNSYGGALLFSRYLYQQTTSTMISLTSMKTGSKEVGNVNMSARLKQLVVLILAILIGMLISITTADAKDYQRQHQKRSKAVYKKYNNTMANACELLKEKRNVSSNKVVRSNSHLKYR